MNNMTKEKKLKVSTKQGINRLNKCAQLINYKGSFLMFPVNGGRNALRQPGSNLTKLVPGTADGTTASTPTMLQAQPARGKKNLSNSFKQGIYILNYKVQLTII